MFFPVAHLAICQVVSLEGVVEMWEVRVSLLGGWHLHEVVSSFLYHFVNQPLLLSKNVFFFLLHTPYLYPWKASFFMVRTWNGLDLLLFSHFPSSLLQHRHRFRSLSWAAAAAAVVVKVKWESHSSWIRTTENNSPSSMDCSRERGETFSNRSSRPVAVIVAGMKKKKRRRSPWLWIQRACQRNKTPSSVSSSFLPLAGRPGGLPSPSPPPDLAVAKQYFKMAWLAKCQPTYIGRGYSEYIIVLQDRQAATRLRNRPLGSYSSC